MPYVNPFQGNAGINPFMQAMDVMKRNDNQVPLESLNTDTNQGLGFLSDFLKRGFQQNQQGSFENWLRGRYDSLLNAYGTRDLNVPGADQLSWMQYLTNNIPDLIGDWSTTSQASRGMRPENFLSQRTRWIR
jgi:hypothetical protein